jgi:hypothetical protein
MTKNLSVEKKVAYHRIRVIIQDTYNGHNLIVKKNGTARFQIVFVDERHDADIIFGSNTAEIGMYVRGETEKQVLLQRAVSMPSSPHTPPPVP